MATHPSRRASASPLAAAAADEGPSSTGAYSYRQPAVGQAFVDLVEGSHPRNLTLDTFAGKYLLICCFGSSRIGPGRAALDALLRHAAMFDDADKCFLGVAVDPAEMVAKLPQKAIRFFLDADGAISRHCGAAPVGAVPLGLQHRVTWTVVDPSLHVAAHFHTAVDAAACDAVFDFLARLPGTDAFTSREIPAPVLILPRLFEPEFCAKLIKLYEQGQPRDSGFMRNNVETFDYSFKRRRDYFIKDEAVQSAILKRVALCVIPEVRKLFFMKVTRMERYLVGCYAADEDAHFRPHRDNGQTVTAHRRFALSVALNDDFDGGELLFPEYNLKPHKVPTGWCVVFPCAVLHAVRPVSRGRRYVFLPFLYDETGAKLKVENAKAVTASPQ